MKHKQSKHTITPASIPLQVGVKIFLRGKQGKYLLLERSSLKYPRIKNKWDIPGGRIIIGTPVLANLRREVHEETGLKILGRPKLIEVQDIIREGEKHIVRITYLGATAGIPKLNDEHINFKWFTLLEMKRFRKLDEFTRDVLEKRFLTS